MKRKFNADELFMIDGIIGAIGIENINIDFTKYSNLFDKSKNVGNSEVIQIGVDLFKLILGKLNKAKYEVYELISSYKSMDINIIKSLDYDEFLSILKDMFKDGLASVFFTQLKELTNEETQENQDIQS